MTDYERIELVIRYLDENFKAQPSLKDLAKVAGLSEFHFQRLFRRWTGITPKSFLQYLTAKHAKELLRASRDVLSTTIDSGLSSPSRLHDLLITIEAVTPGEFKAKGAGVEIRYGVHQTPFGPCLLGLTPRGICHLTFVGQDLEEAIDDMKKCWPNARFKTAKAATAKMVKQIFGIPGKRRINLLVQGTEFQIKVWEALLQIPEGAVISYDHLARLAGAPKAARAVGSAIGRNSIAFLIPCHRVIRETGIFGQYRWGPARKRVILSWERLRKDIT